MLDEISFDMLARRAKTIDDRKEYAAKKKYGKTYKQFMDKDDRKEYKDKMKYGKHGK